MSDIFAELAKKFMRKEEKPPKEEESIPADRNTDEGGEQTSPSPPTDSGPTQPATQPATQVGGPVQPVEEPPQPPAQRPEPEEGEEREESRSAELIPAGRNKQEDSSSPSPPDSGRSTSQSQPVMALTARSSQVAKAIARAKEIERLDSIIDRVESKLHDYIKEMAGNDYPVLERIRLETGKPLIEVAIIKEKVTPLELFNKLKEIAREEGIEDAVIWDDGFGVEVVEVEENGQKVVKYRYGGAEVEVYYTLSPLAEVRGKKALVVVPWNQWSRLKGVRSVAETGSSLKFTIDDLVAAAHNAGASDVHLIPKEDGVYCFFRINKQLVMQAQFFMPFREWETFRRLLESKIAESSTIEIENTMIIKEGKADFPSIGVSIRYVYIPDGHSRLYGEQVFRILKREAVPINVSLEERLKSFGYDERTIRVLRRVTKQEGALIVISGKTNSGKSTLLAQLIASIAADGRKKVATVEDPIEYVYNAPNVVQHQIFQTLDSKNTVGFLEFVKAFKRADTDVVLIGEWRRSEGLTEAMVEQAQAGQLIFTTLHIKSAFEIYDALYNMYGVDYAVSTTLIKLSFNQSLVPKLCPECSQPDLIRFDEEEIALMPFLTEREKDKLSSFVVEGRKRGKGCPKCGGSGVIGVVPIYEYFVPTIEVTEKVKHGQMSPLEIKKTLESDPKAIYRSKVEQTLQLLQEGVIEKDTVFTLW